MSFSLRLPLSIPLLLLTLAACDTGSSADDGSGGAGGSSATAGAGGTASTAGASGAAGTGGAAGGSAVTCARPDAMPAVTLTYDDALNSQLTTAAPALKAHGLKATFFVTDVRTNPAPWSALLADGHELASHTFRHPCPKVNTWVAPGNANEDYDVTRMTTELDESVAMLQMLGNSRRTRSPIRAASPGSARTNRATSR